MLSIVCSQLTCLSRIGWTRNRKLRQLRKFLVKFANSHAIRVLMPTLDKKKCHVFKYKKHKKTKKIVAPIITELVVAT